MKAILIVPMMIAIVTSSIASGLPTTQPTGARTIETDARVDASVAAGLAYLAQQQNADGSWEGGGPPVAMTGLSLMAYLAGGHTPDVGKYGLVVRRAMDRLVEFVPEDGYFGKVDGSKMYGQGSQRLPCWKRWVSNPTPRAGNAFAPRPSDVLQ
jgi:hypothetical protein